MPAVNIWFWYKIVKFAVSLYPVPVEDRVLRKRINCYKLLTINSLKMNFKKLFLAVAVCAVAVSSASAQVVKGAEAQTKRGPYETNRFFDNVFVGVAGGVNYYMGESDSKMDFQDRLAPAVQAYVGKWITPSVGVRLGYYGIKAKGFTRNAANPYVSDTYQNGYEQKMNLNQVRGDFMWNVSNAISGYRADRFWDIAPYVGFGWMWSAAEHKVNGSKHRNNELAVTAGIYSMFRLTQALDLTLDINNAYVNQRLDGEVGGSRQEYVASVSLGLAYNFRNREFSRAHAAVDVTPYNEKIKDLNNALAAANAKNADLKKALDEANNRPAKEVIVKGKDVVAPSKVALFFSIGRATLDAASLQNIKNFAEGFKKADSSRKLYVEGSADSATGSATTNNRLGEKRMNAVVDILVNEYGIDKDRIVTNNRGGINEYKPNKLNRCVVLY